MKVLPSYWNRALIPHFHLPNTSRTCLLTWEIFLAACGHDCIIRHFGDVAWRKRRYNQSQQQGPHCGHLSASTSALRIPTSILVFLLMRSAIVHLNGGAQFVRPECVRPGRETYPVMHHLTDFFTDELYLAGQPVPSGLYREVDTGREIHMEEQDQLPASLDGKVASYICVQYTWGQQRDQQGSAAHR